MENRTADSPGPRFLPEVEEGLVAERKINASVLNRLIPE
jgi:hypothetical protein